MVKALSFTKLTLFHLQQFLYIMRITWFFFLYFLNKKFVNLSFVQASWVTVTSVQMLKNVPWSYGKLAGMWKRSATHSMSLQVVSIDGKLSETVGLGEVRILPAFQPRSRSQWRTLWLLCTLKFGLVYSGIVLMEVSMSWWACVVMFWWTILMWLLGWPYVCPGCALWCASCMPHVWLPL